MRSPRLTFLLALSCSGALLACEAESQEQAREVAKNAARKAGTKLEEKVERARDGLADARERHEVDAKLAAAQARFSEAMDEAALEFAALAESGTAGGQGLAGKVDRSGHMIAVAPAAVDCEQADETEARRRRCRVDPQLIAVLRESPMSLARDASLRPRKGSTGAGLELVRISDGGLSQAIGLREGDILLELNGVELSSFEAIGALDEALRGQYLVTLSYERAGAREIVEIMQQVNEDAATQER